MENIGKLYIVATPIGNVSDISQRAQTVLATADMVLCEDTRQSRKLCTLLNLADIKLRAFHNHNEISLNAPIIEQLKAGANIALISDAGTPLISDPGYQLVKSCHDQNIEVCAIPGPCAIVAALSIAGVPTLPFTFLGFLPSKSQARQQALTTALGRSETVVFFEAPHRLLTMLADSAQVAHAEQTVVLVKEMTKVHEKVIQGTINETILTLHEHPQWVRGEFVIIFPPLSKKQAIDATFATHIAQLLEAEMGTVKAAKMAAKITGENKKILYQWLLDHAKKSHQP